MFYLLLYFGFAKLGSKRVPTRPSWNAPLDTDLTTTMATGFAEKQSVKAKEGEKAADKEYWHVYQAETTLPQLPDPGPNKASDKRNVVWSLEEIDVFLTVIGCARIQRAFYYARKKESVYREISAMMAKRGFQRTWMQCREKQKKLKCEYSREKALRASSGFSGKASRWFKRLDAIYRKWASSLWSDIKPVLLKSTPLGDTDSAAKDRTPTSRCEDNAPLSSRSLSPVPGSSAACTMELPSPQPRPTACDRLTTESPRKSLSLSHFSDKRRTREQSDIAAIMKDMHEHNKEMDRRRLEQCDRKHQLLEAQAARKAEMATKAAEQEAYERARAVQMDERFLTVLQTFANALSHHGNPTGRGLKG